MNSTRYYDAAAASFEAAYNPESICNDTLKPFMINDHDNFEKLICRCEYRQGILLDLGCGTGYWSKKFSEKHEQTHCIDQSQLMLNKAKINLSNLRCDITYMSYDINELINLRDWPYRYESILLSFVLSHFEDKKAIEILHWCLNVLSPSGLIYFNDSSWSYSRASIEAKKIMIKTNSGGTVFKIYRNEQELSSLFFEAGGLVESMYFGEAYISCGIRK